MKELNLNEMEQVSGGVWRTVNTGVEGLNAALRNRLLPFRTERRSIR